MKLLEGFVENNDKDEVCLLKKSVYELKQYARSWNRTIHNILEKSGFRQSDMDPCLYNSLEGVELTFVLIYVDDILIYPKYESTISDMKNMFENAFRVSDLGPIENYLGLQVYRSGNGFYSISQPEYIKMLAENGLPESKPSSVSITASYGKSGIEKPPLNNNYKYKKLLGRIFY